MLHQLIDEKLIEARGIIGFYAANQVDVDDIEFYSPEDDSQPIGKFFTLRQQLDIGASDNFVAMSDFIAPKESGIKDYVGAFAVSAGFKQEALSAKFMAEDDDYNNMMLKTLTDRLAEAFSEELHTEVRRNLWGYSADETLTPAQCLNVQY